MSFYAYTRIDGSRYRERFGLDFEDFAAGQRFRHRPGVTLSQQDNVDEALDTVNSAMISDSAYSVSPPNTGAVIAISENPVSRSLRPKVFDDMPIRRCRVTVLTISSRFQAVCAAYLAS